MAAIFLIVDPDPGIRRAARRLDAKVRQRSDRAYLQIPHIAMHVFAQLRAQIDDRINHQLAGAVIGHIAAAAGAMDRDFLRREHIRFLAAATEGVNMRMFDEEQNVGRVIRAA